MAGVTLEVTGIDECLKAFSGLEKDLRKTANGELRAAAMKTAREVIPMLGGSGSPQEAAILGSLGARSDRLPTVAVVRKPKLSGLKKTPAGIAKGAVLWPIEQGSDYKAFHGPPAGGIAGRHRAQIAQKALGSYMKALADISRKWGLL